MASRCCFSVLALQLVLLASLAHSLPFVIFHGLNNSCEQYTPLTEGLIFLSGSKGSCVEIGNGFKDSLFMPMEKQVEIACEQVKQMPELSEGYNIVGVSQGTMVARGVIEFCDGGPPIRNYVSVGGVHAGVAKAPLCQDDTTPLPDYCRFVDYLQQARIVYGECAQTHLAPIGYMKLPKEYDAYIKGSRFLPKLNNEYDTKNPIYKQRFASLENLVLIKFEQDQILIPKETSWFEYYADGDDNTVLPVRETRLYKEDWIGLKTLDEAGKVRFVSLPLNHVNMTIPELEKYVVPYLKDHQAPTHAIM